MDLVEFLVKNFADFMQIRLLKSFWPRVSSLLREWYEHEMHKKYVRKEEMVMISSFEDVSVKETPAWKTTLSSKAKRKRPLELEESSSTTHLRSQGEMVLDRTVLFVDRVLSMHPEWWNGPLLRQTAEDLVGLVGVHPLVDSIFKRLSFADPDAVWYILMTHVGAHQGTSVLDQYVKERYPGWSGSSSFLLAHGASSKGRRIGGKEDVHPLQSCKHVLEWMDENGL